MKEARSPVKAVERGQYPLEPPDMKKRKCKYFPCHERVAEREFDCMWCYCPLYEIDCAGRYEIVGKDMVKDCTNCIMPHAKEGIKYILRRINQFFDRIAE